MIIASIRVHLGYKQTVINFSLTAAELKNQELHQYQEIISKQQQELQALRSELDCLNSDLEVRKEMTSELEIQVQNLEKKVGVAEEEARGAAHQLCSALETRDNLSSEVGFFFFLSYVFLLSRSKKKLMQSCLADPAL